MRTPCNCTEEIRAKLNAEGLAISAKCQTMRIRKLKLSTHIGFPLETRDGKKPKRGQATFLFLSFCPFCGAEYEKAETQPEAAR